MNKSFVIGTHIKIIHASNASLIGLTGVVVDETQHTLVITVGSKQKRVLKHTCVFEQNGLIVSGQALVKCSYERIKK